MQARIEYEHFQQLLPAAGQAMRALSAVSREAGLDPKLLELVKIRASQINGCAFCLAMHFADARRMGESEARLDLLPAWRETPLYSERERAALAWTEALTLITDGRAPDETYDWVRAQFSEQELAGLTWAIVHINSWNRVAISMRFLPKVAVPAAATA